MHFSLQHGAPPKLHLQVGEAVLNSTSKAYPEEEEGVKAEVKTPLRLELTNAKKICQIYAPTGEIQKGHQVQTRLFSVSKQTKPNVGKSLQVAAKPFGSVDSSA